jgi:predicted nucleotidyltransferase
MVNEFSNIIKEVIEPDDVDVSSIKMNETLSPLIWDTDDVLKSDVRKTLLKNAQRFIEFSGIEKLKFNDIVFTGSMANYNYTDNSDLDVHIIFDFSQISENLDFINDYFKLKKDLWSHNLPIQVKGHDVEVYFQNSSEKHQSSGVYSLQKNTWIRKPLKQIINIDTVGIKAKSTDMMNEIDNLETENQSLFLTKYKEIKDKIKKYRQAGLERVGEYSIENLVFKILRNTGYIGKLINMKNSFLTKELSLTEINN